MNTTSALPWNQLTEEQQEAADILLAEHDERIRSAMAADPQHPGHRIKYVIDVTGKHSVYYTFWRLRIPTPQEQQFIGDAMGSSAFEPKYICNLPSTLPAALAKAISYRGNLPIEIWREGTLKGVANKDGLHFTFGKYRGYSLGDVYATDPNYIIWLNKNADERYAHKPFNQAIANAAAMAIEEIIAQNREKSQSRYVGQVGKYWEGQLTVYAVKAYESSYDGSTQRYYSLTDSAGNKFSCKNLQKKWPTALDKGSVINVKCFIKGHLEKMGIQFTQISRIKAI